MSNIIFENLFGVMFHMTFVFVLIQDYQQVVKVADWATFTSARD